MEHAVSANEVDDDVYDTYEYKYNWISLYVTKIYACILLWLLLYL